jgi:hypothetical protein
MVTKHHRRDGRSRSDVMRSVTRTTSSVYHSDGAIYVTVEQD